MSKLTDDFLKFLLERHKLTGKTSFPAIEYRDFDGYEAAIEELSSRGVITRIPDILGTIQVNVPQK